METQTSYGSKTLGIIMTLCGGLLWAIGGSCGQKIFELYHLSSNWLVPVRMLVAGLILLLIAFFRYPPKAVFSVWSTPKDAKNLILFSIFGAGASQYTYYTCIQYSNAAFATVISYLFPVLILLYSMLRNKRPPKGYELLCVLLVTFGAFTCSTHWNLEALSVPPIAIAIGLLCALTAAYNTIKPQELLRRYALLSIMGWSMFLAGVILCLIFRPWTIPTPASFQLFLLMSVVILGGTVFAFGFYQGGVRIVGSLSGSILASVEPVGAVLIAVLFLQVPFTLADFIGFVLILITIPIIALGQQRESRVMGALLDEDLTL